MVVPRHIFGKDNAKIFMVSFGDYHGGVSELARYNGALWGSGHEWSLVHPHELIILIIRMYHVLSQFPSPGFTHWSPTPTPAPLPVLPRALSHSILSIVHQWEFKNLQLGMSRWTQLVTKPNPLERIWRNQNSISLPISCPRMIRLLFRFPLSSQNN